MTRHNPTLTLNNGVEMPALDLGVDRRGGAHRPAQRKELVARPDLRQRRLGVPTP
ncbi:hypothetical protein ABZ646_02260 [Streptomyces sp. NPDC007162]|uniref:hypothetical protein n=1 Tax=Streptomyces sp. NPDC007162 TaxID=3156917 RepID=UPI0033C8FCD7